MANMLTVTVGTTDYTFDWIAQHIHIEAGVTEVSASDLRQAIHDAQDDVVAMPFPAIATFYNPVTLSGSASTFLNVVLNDQWRIESLSGSGTLTVGGGNVVNVNNGIDIFVPNALVSMVNNTSAAGVLVESGVSGLTAQESAQLAELAKRLDLDGDQTYADDGSSIVNPSFTLTKSDNGNGTFDLVRTPT